MNHAIEIIYFGLAFLEFLLHFWEVLGSQFNRSIGLFSNPNHPTLFDCIQNLRKVANHTYQHPPTTI